jgi:hypothetical protein
MPEAPDPASPLEEDPLYAEITTLIGGMLQVEGMLIPELENLLRSPQFALLCVPSKTAGILKYEISYGEGVWLAMAVLEDNSKKAYVVKYGEVLHKNREITREELQKFTVALCVNYVLRSSTYHAMRLLGHRSLTEVGLPVPAELITLAKDIAIKEMLTRMNRPNNIVQ